MKNSSYDIYDIYKKLFAIYGPQGWWPLVGFEGTNPTKTGAVNGYHVSDYSFPRTRDECFEICLGCFLTQNTSWTSVEKSLINLKNLNALSPENIMALDDETFKNAIKPSGYHNQKARYIRAFVSFFRTLHDDDMPTRMQLLSCIGIGPETADSMLLYAFRQPEFVVDAYTKRIFMHMKLIEDHASYDTVKTLCQNALTTKIKETGHLVIAYQEFHALLVEHAKRHYNKKPYGQKCFLHSCR